MKPVCKMPVFLQQRKMNKAKLEALRQQPGYRDSDAIDQLVRDIDHVNKQ